MRFAPLALLALLPACGAHEAPLAATTPCATAIQYFETLVPDDRKRRTVLDQHAEQIPERIGPDRWVGTGLAGDPAPPAELLAALRVRGGESAVKACPDLRAMLDRKHVAYQEPALKDAVQLEEDGGYRSVIIGFSLPVLSADGRSALLVTSIVESPEGGVGQLVHLRRAADGRWVVAGEAMTWIS